MMLLNPYRFSSGGGGGGGGSDPHFSSVSLLLHMDGEDGATTFADRSDNAFSVTAVGNARISTALSKFGGASGLFDGNGDYLTVADNAAFEFGSGDFTVEGWCRIASAPAASYELFSKDAGAPGWTAYGLVITGSRAIRIQCSSNGAEHDILATSANSVVPTGAFFHFALVRQGSVFTGYVNGVAVVSTTSDAGLFNNAGPFIVGSRGGGWEALAGCLDEMRITKGVARYSENFTPPTEPFPNS